MIPFLGKKTAMQSTGGAGGGRDKAGEMEMGRKKGALID